MFRLLHWPHTKTFKKSPKNLQEPGTFKKADRETFDFDSKFFVYGLCKKRNTEILILLKDKKMFHSIFHNISHSIFLFIDFTNTSFPFSTKNHCYKIMISSIFINVIIEKLRFLIFILTNFDKLYFIFIFINGSFYFIYIDLINLIRERER